MNKISEQERNITRSFSLHPETSAIIDYWAERQHMSKSAALSMIVVECDAIRKQREGLHL